MMAPAARPTPAAAQPRPLRASLGDNAASDSAPASATAIEVLTKVFIEKSPVPMGGKVPSRNAKDIRDAGKVTPRQGAKFHPLQNANVSAATHGSAARRRFSPSPHRRRSRRADAP